MNTVRILFAQNIRLDLSVGLRRPAACMGDAVYDKCILLAAGIVFYGRD